MTATISLRSKKFSYLILIILQLLITSCINNDLDKIEDKINQEDFALFGIIDSELKIVEDTLIIFFHSEHDNIHYGRIGLFFEKMINIAFKELQNSEYVKICIFGSKNEIFTIYNPFQRSKINNKYKSEIYSEAYDYIIYNVENEAFVVFDGILNGLFKAKKDEIYNIDFTQLFQGFISECQNDNFGLNTETIKLIKDYLEYEQENGKYLKEYNHIVKLYDICYR